MGIAVKIAGKILPNGFSCEIEFLAAVANLSEVAAGGGKLLRDFLKSVCELFQRHFFCQRIHSPLVILLLELPSFLISLDAFHAPGFFADFPSLSGIFPPQAFSQLGCNKTRVEL